MLSTGLHFASESTLLPNNNMENKVACLGQQLLPWC